VHVNETLGTSFARAGAPMPVLPFVLAAMTQLAPGRDHAALADAIARVVDREPPLFANDDDRRRTAALLVAVAFRESTLHADAVGDGGTSFCAFQIHRSAGGSRELLDAPERCVQMGFAILRTSVKTCSSHPVAWYASGPAGCTNPRAQRISRDRMALAAYLVRVVPAAG
jgi:hypothetical protein